MSPTCATALGTHSPSVGWPLVRNPYVEKSPLEWSPIDVAYSLPSSGAWSWPLPTRQPGGRRKCKSQSSEYCPEMNHSHRLWSPESHICFCCKLLPYYLHLCKLHPQLWHPNKVAWNGISARWTKSLAAKRMTRQNWLPISEFTPGTKSRQVDLPFLPSSYWPS